jgi:hypothetical protein
MFCKLGAFIAVVIQIIYWQTVIVHYSEASSKEDSVLFLVVLAFFGSVP